MSLDQQSRVGIVDYGVAAPYAAAFPDAERGTPAELNELAEQGELDYVLTSSLALMELGWPVFSRCGIGSEGPVKSSVLVSERRLEAVERLRLDPASRTSNTIARILVRDANRMNRPEFDVRDPGAELLERSGDAAVVIGDPALELETSADVFDLATLWKNTTRTGCVFALWGVREPEEGETEFIDTVANAVGDAQQRGFDKEIQELIKRTGVERELAEEYFTECVDYRFTDSHHAGLRTFVSKANQLTDIELDPPRFFDN